MNELINEILSTAIQVVAFSLIPFIFFLLRRDKSVSFFRFVGLYRPTNKSMVYVPVAALLFLIIGIGLIFVDESKEVLFSPNSVTGKLRSMGFSATTVLILLVIALLKTSFAEEILFRGFLARQLINKLGFTKGNILQAIIFGSIHLLLFWAITGATIVLLVLIFIFSTAAGWTIGYIQEKFANGSIIPGWAAHGLGNTLSYMIIAFAL